MTSARTAVRAAAVLGATAALTVAGAGAASAATTASANVEGSTVSVTFESTHGDTCGAALVPPTAGLEILDNVGGNNGLDGILDSIDALEGVQVLKKGPLSAVLVLPGGSNTVSATNVPSGAYGLVTVCLSTLSSPDISVLTVGSPLDIINAMSSGGGLDTLSSVLGGGDTEGALDLGTLSSALGETEN